MPTLKEKLTTPPEQRRRVVVDCVRLIDDEMGRKRGLLAMPLKAGYKLVRGLRPGFVGDAVDFLLDEFCDALDPFYQRWSSQDAGGRPPLAEALRRESEPAAEALLAVTDRRAERSTNRVIVKTYRKLRGTAKTHVQEALPGAGRTIEPHVV